MAIAPIVLVAMLIASCNQATPPPSHAIASILSNTPTAAPTAEVAPPSPTPTSSCPPIPEIPVPSSGSVVVDLLAGQAELYVGTTAYQGADGNWVKIPRDDPRTGNLVVAIGSRDLHIAYRPASGSEDQAEGGPFEAVTVGIERAAGDVFPLVARPDGSGARVALPDQAIDGSLIIQVSWSDDCFAYAGTAEAPIEIVPAAVADACPDVDGILRQVAASQTVQVGVGTGRAGLGTNSWEARFIPGDGADQVAPFASFDPRRAPAAVPSGATMPVRILDPGYQLMSVEVAAYRWDEVVDANGDIRPTDATPLELPVTWQPEGTVEVTAPAAPGRYVLSIDLWWERPCWIGHGLTYLALTTS